MYRVELFTLGIMLLVVGMVPGVILDSDGIWRATGIVIQTAGIVVLLTYIRLAARAQPNSSDTSAE